MSFALSPLSYYVFKCFVYVYSLNVYISLCTGYLLGIVYNKLFVKRSVEIKHIFNVVSGLLIVYYNFGNGIWEYYYFENYILTVLANFRI